VNGLELAALAGLGVIGIVAARLDIRQRRLPHWLCAITLVAGLGVVMAAGGPMVSLSAVLHAALALLGGMLFYAAGLIGGGDAKFYAAMAGWFALRDGLFLLVNVTLCGLILLALWFLLRGRRPQPSAMAGSKTGSEAEPDPFTKLPYGVAIAAGGFVSYAMLALRY
jgi:prepilin peptidase CpaA